jgi:hypothetical protein
VSVGASTVRTLLRLIDVWLTLGILGMLCIMGTRQNQRLGDLAAGTVDGLDVTDVDAVELAAIRDFLSRRDALDDASRARAADALAGRLSPKVGGVIPGSVGSEHILELVLAAKSRPGSEAR